MKVVTILFSCIIFQIANIIPSQMMGGHNYPNTRDLSTDTSNNKSIPYSPEPAQPLRVIFDYYHHALPSTKVGKYITTGSWKDDLGRYGWDDFVHTNTFDHAYIALERDYQISMGREPYSKQMLEKTDIVVIITADNPATKPSAIPISDQEIKALRQFVKEGGSLMIMINAIGEGRSHEGFEKIQLGKLVRSFGLDWNNTDTHYSDNSIPLGHSHFYDVPNFHYGAGCTLKILPGAPEPEVLLDVYSDSTYTDRDVRGPGIIMVRPGKGKFILVGDGGSWTGNMSRPWADNTRILKQLFLYLHPDREVNPPSLPVGKSWEYEVAVSGLQAVPVTNSLSKIDKPRYKMFPIRPRTDLPYFEKTADLQLICKESTEQNASKMVVKISNIKWFDEPSENNNDQDISFTVSRQGKVSKLETNGYEAQWFAPDVSVLIALLPVDGLRPGDRWNSVEPVRVPIFRGTDLPPIKSQNMDIVYVRDSLVDGINCRLLRSSNEIWLDELGVSVEELVPKELVQRVGGSHYKFFSERGGKLLYKREQWVDQNTGIVLKARIQTRIVAWIQDVRKPIPETNLDKDNEMIVSLAHIVNFKLK